MISRPTRPSPLYLTWSPFPISPQHGGYEDRRGEGTVYYPRVICLVQVILPAHLSNGYQWMDEFFPHAGPASLASSPGDPVG